MRTTTLSTRRSVAIVAAGLFGLSLVAVGCSSSDNDTASPTTAAKGDDTFRIGLEGPLTGEQAAVGQGMLRGAEFAAEELNDEGGIDGKQVEIVAIDDKADPDAGKAAAKAAIDEGLDAVVGPYNSGVGSQTLPLYIDAGIVPLRLTSADSTEGLGFTLQPMTSQIAPAAVTAITTWAEAKSVGIIYDSTQEYTNGAAEAIRALLPDAGVEITADEAIEPGADSYAEVVDRVLATDPGLLYVVTYSPEAGTIARDVAVSDSDARCLIDYGGFDNGYVDAAGIEAGQRCPVVGVPAASDFPGSAAKGAAYRKMFSEAPGAWSPYTYDSVLLIADAVERAGSADAGPLTKALAETSGWTGWTGTVTFDAKTGNRQPAPVTVDSVDDEGNFSVDPTWAAAVDFSY
jgi:branched-chain amino acid transport system substrate-binding protein